MKFLTWGHFRIFDDSMSLILCIRLQIETITWLVKNLVIFIVCGICSYDLNNEISDNEIWKFASYYFIYYFATCSLAEKDFLACDWCKEVEAFNQGIWLVYMFVLIFSQHTCTLSTHITDSALNLKSIEKYLQESLILQNVWRREQVGTTFGCRISGTYSSFRK